MASMSSTSSLNESSSIAPTRSSIRIKNNLIESKRRKKGQYVYISSSENYAMKHTFKIGGVGCYENLKRRLSAYNGRSSREDKWNYYHYRKVANFRQVERRLLDVLSEFKDKPGKNTEMIKLPFEDLKTIVDIVVDNYNNEVDFTNEQILSYMEGISPHRQQTTTPTPIQIEPPIQPKKDDINKTKQQQLKDEIEKYMYDKLPNKRAVYITRNEVIEHCIGKLGKINKRDAWKFTKEIGLKNKAFKLILKPIEPVPGQKKITDFFYQL